MLQHVQVQVFCCVYTFCSGTLQDEYNILRQKEREGKLGKGHPVRKQGHVKVCEVTMAAETFYPISFVMQHAI